MGELGEIVQDLPGLPAQISLPDPQQPKGEQEAPHPVVEGGGPLLQGGQVVGEQDRKPHGWPLDLPKGPVRQSSEPFPGLGNQ
jgi:hypothetical protein